MVTPVAMPQRSDRRASVSIDSWIRIGLVVAAFAPFVGTLFYGFIFDDTVILLHNPVLRGWTSLLEVWRHRYFANGGAEQSGLYRPLLMAFFALIWNAAHGFAIAFHLFAVTAHAVATLLVAKLLRRGVGRWAGAGGAMWFALLPVHVEAVASVANVSEVLVSIWTVLLALWLLPPRDTPASSSNAPGWGRAVVAAILYAAALLSKESGGVAPGLALLAVVAWRRSAASDALGDVLVWSRGWLRVIALWIAALVAVMIVRRIVLGGVVGTGSMAVPGLAGLSAGQRILATLSLGGRAAQLLLWPTTQSPDYGPSALASEPARAIAATLTIVAILTMLVACCRLAWRAHRPDSRPLAGVGWCLLAFLPASNLLGATGAVLAERTLYVSSVGVAMIVAWGLDRILERIAERRQSHAGLFARLMPIAATVGFAAVCARGYVQAREYSRVWRDHRTLFTQIVRADSLSYRGYQLLALEAKDNRRYEESAALYARAYALLPSDPLLLADYGEYLLEMKRPRYALTMGQRLFRHADRWTDPRAVTLLLTATGRVWGADSVRAAAQRLQAHAPNALAAHASASPEPQE